MRTKTILAVVVMVTLGITTSFSQETKKETLKNSAETSASFGVRGNCGMCKTTIEKAAKSVIGVSKAVWNKEAKKIDISFDSSETDIISIEKAVAASGYDTETETGNLKAYKNLPGCCKYDREMKMNQKL